MKKARGKLISRGIDKNRQAFLFEQADEKERITTGRRKSPYFRDSRLPDFLEGSEKTN